MKSHAKTGSPVGVEMPTGAPVFAATRQPQRTRGRRFWRAFWRVHWYLLGLVVVLLVLRLFLPYGVEWYVNRQLNKAQGYGGGVGAVHLQLWRGSYQINDLKIFKRNGTVPVPLFAASRLHLSIEWKELFHGSVVGQVKIVKPSLNFVAGPTEAQAQTGRDESWSGMLSSLFPFDINRLEIDEGQIHFQNEHSTPPVDIYINKLFATATNLTNSRKVSGELPAGVTARGTTLGGGSMVIDLQLNPMAASPAYQLVAQLTNVDLVALNDFLKAYGKFDVERGKFALYASVAGKGGAYDGYLKVFFNNLDVFAWEKERQKNALGIFWEAIVGSVAGVLKNHPKDSLAARIPISGSYNHGKVGVISAVGTLLRNAFIRALVPKIDEKVTVQNVEHKAEEKKKLENSPPPEKGAQQLARPPG